jgi:hypothetical protein
MRVSCTAGACNVHGAEAAPPGANEAVAIAGGVGVEAGDLPVSLMPNAVVLVASES